MNYLNDIYSWDHFEESTANFRKSLAISKTSDSNSEISNSSEDEMDIDISQQQISSRLSSEVLSLNKIQYSLLEFCISLLNDPTISDKINCPFIISLAILGVTLTGFHGPEVYLSKLFAILKASRFLVLRYSYEETTTYSSEIEIDNLDSDSSSRLRLALKN